MGLPIFELPNALEIKEGELVSIDLENGKIDNVDTDTSYNFTPIPEFMQELLACGGLMNFAKKEAHGKL
jgi:3-isopropylmalate/(R)-2-methylmalate dehydratase small subunit